MSYTGIKISLSGKVLFRNSNADFPEKAKLGN